MAENKKEETVQGIDIEALKEKLRAEIRAEDAATAQQKEKSAETIRKNALDEAKKDLVEIELFQDDDKYANDVIVCVNGDRYQIQRGKRVKVPRFIADVLQQSAEQDKSTARMIARYESEYKQAVDTNHL